MSMLSRIADSLFWLHRYMERSDGLILTLRNSYILSFDKDLHDTLGYQPLLGSFTTLETPASQALEQDVPALLKYILTDTSNHNSFKVLVSKARENARGSQDKITKELWEHINGLYHYILSPGLDKQLSGHDALPVIDYLQQQTLLYHGVVDSTMPRGLGWSFMNIGKFIERCLQTINLTEVYFTHIKYQLNGPEDIIFWRRLLLSLSGYELYLKSNTNHFHSRQVINQVIFKKDFPRSVLYALIRIEKYLKDILDVNQGKASIALEKEFGRLKSLVEFTDPACLTNEGLEELLPSIRQQVWDFSTSLSKLYFSYT